MRIQASVDLVSPRNFVGPYLGLCGDSTLADPVEPPRNGGIFEEDKTSSIETFGKTRITLRKVSGSNSSNVREGVRVYART